MIWFNTWIALGCIGVSGFGCLALSRLLRRKAAGYPCRNCRGELEQLCEWCQPRPTCNWSEPPADTFVREVA